MTLPIRLISMIRKSQKSDKTLLGTDISVTKEYNLAVYIQYNIIFRSM